MFLVSTYSLIIHELLLLGLFPTFPQTAFVRVINNLHIIGFQGKISDLIVFYLLATFEACFFFQNDLVSKTKCSLGFTLTPWVRGTRPQSLLMVFPWPLNLMPLIFSASIHSLGGKFQSCGCKSSHI